METQFQIQLAITTINEASAAGHLYQEELSHDVRGITHGLSEYFIAETIYGAPAAIGYSEAELLANLLKMLPMYYIGKFVGYLARAEQQTQVFTDRAAHFLNTADLAQFHVEGPLLAGRTGPEFEAAEGGAK